MQDDWTVSGISFIAYTPRLHLSVLPTVLVFITDDIITINSDVLCCSTAAYVFHVVHLAPDNEKHDIILFVVCRRRHEC